MQTVFQLNTKEIDLKFIKLIKNHFKNKTVKITVEAWENSIDSDTLKRFKDDAPIKIAPDVDLRVLIDDASDPNIFLK